MRFAVSAVQACSYLLWFPLMILTITAVFRAGVRRYPLCFTYLVVTFLIAVVQVPAMMAYRSDPGQLKWVNEAYQVGEGVACTFMLAVVVNLIYRATERVGARRMVRFALVGGALTFMVGSLLLHYDARAGLANWMMLWTRDQSLCAAILDFALWTLLLTSRDRDTKLLLLTGGMGIMFAGDAIAAAIHHVGALQRSNGIFLSGNLVAILADSTSLYVWWRTFRSDRPSTLAHSNGK